MNQAALKRTYDPPAECATRLLYTLIVLGLEVIEPISANVCFGKRVLNIRGIK